MNKQLITLFAAVSTLFFTWVGYGNTTKEKTNITPQANQEMDMGIEQEENKIEQAHQKLIKEAYNKQNNIDEIENHLNEIQLNVSAIETKHIDLLQEKINTKEVNKHLSFILENIKEIQEHIKIIDSHK